MNALMSHPWPGNIRELRAVVENAAIVTRSGLVAYSHIESALQARREDPGYDSWQGLAAAPVRGGEEPSTQVSGVMPAVRETTASAEAAPPTSNEAPGPARAVRAPSLPDLQRDMILRAFEESQHNLSKAAQDLGIPRSTLRARLRRYGVR
jgi:DNA-binding NtrC family response regulator